MEKVKDYKITILPPFEGYSDYYCEGRIGSDSKHGDIMREYGILVYGDNSIFSILGEDCIPTTAEYFLELYGNVVFYNLSGDFGILCVMGDINEKQRRALDIVLKQIPDYTVEIDYFMMGSHSLELYEPFEDSGDFLDIKSYLDCVTVKDKVKVKSIKKGF